ncbi:MAG: ABC transporter substrate-binding protein [Tissierellaceae bacterium]
MGSKKSKLVLVFLTFTLLMSMVLSACSGGQETGRGKIVFANAQWESNMFHNAVAGRIAEEVFGYTWEEIPGSTAVMHEGLINGEIDVHMEEWTDNIPQYQPDLDAGNLQELSVNFADNYQGLYVPRYVIEGDSDRGIEASAPKLKSVKDLKDYANIFPDDEEAGMGRIYGAIPGWEVDTILQRKYKFLGLDENYVYFSPGSDAALQAAIISAYDKGEPIVAYYWEPTWLLGLYDMVLLEDEAYVDDESFKAGETELPAMNVTVAVSNKFYENEDNKDMVDFLSKYETSSELTSEALGFMQSNDADYYETAEWFLREHDELLDKWLSAEDADKMRKALD